MLCAKTKKGDFVTLALLSRQQIEHLRRKEQFYCPECKGSVIVKAGYKVIPHFAHQSITNCSHYGGEGIYHQKGKLLLYQWLRKQNIYTEIEAYLPEIQQRPDLLIRIGKRQIALEYQCAKISVEEIRKRTAGYERADITPIWILGANQFKRTSYTHFHMNAFTKQFIQQFSSKLPTQLFYLCPLTKTISIINDIYETSTTRAFAKMTFKNLQNLPFTHLFSSERLSTHSLFSLWQKEKRKFRLYQSRAYGNELKWRYWLYEKGFNRESLPSIVYLPVKGQHTMNVPLWNWQSRLIIEFLNLLPIGKEFSYSEVRRFLQSFISQTNRVLLIDPITEYLSLLIKLKIIKQTSEYDYVKINAIPFYNHIEQAINGDDELLHILMYNQK